MIDTKQQLIRDIETPYDFRINFNDGAFVEILCEDPNREFDVDFQVEGVSQYRTTLKGKHWASTSVKYLRNWQVIISDPKTNEVFRQENFNPEKKNVWIKFDSSALGDTIAWVPYVEEFRKKYNCNVYVTCFFNDLFVYEYPDVNFVPPNHTPNVDMYATYMIGWYYDDKGFNEGRNPVNPLHQTLQKTICDIIGLDFGIYGEIRPRIFVKNKPSTKKNQICIGIHSSAQPKYWNNPDGWKGVLEYCDKSGLDVLHISKERNGYMGNFITGKYIDKTGDFPLQERITDLLSSKAYIGIGSGLSWLAWALGVPTILISGFSAENQEMSVGVKRIINKDVCNGCFARHLFDRGDWNWCPDHKGTSEQFICSKSISPESVITALKEFLSEYDAVKEVNHSFVNKPKVAVYHLFTRPEDDREVRSREQFDSPVWHLYKEFFNKPTTSMPPNRGSMRPDRISPVAGHYLVSPGAWGCWQAHTNAIKDLDFGYDATLILECDALLNNGMSVKEFRDLCNVAVDIMKTENVLLWSFGPPSGDNIGMRESSSPHENYEWGIWNKLIEAHAYMIPRNNYLLMQREIANSRWDVFDLWVSNHFKGKRKIGGFLGEPVSLQASGVSLIDGKMSTENIKGMPKI